MVHTDRGDVQAEIVILAAGVLETPAILMRSGFEAGAGVQPHLQTVVWGDFADRVDGFNGIPMTYGVLEFADVYGHHGPGFVIEGVSLQPLAFSAQPPGDGELKSEILSRYRYLAGALMLLRPRGRGRVRLSADRPVVDFPWHVDDMARTKTFVSRAVELWLASGAKRALLPHRSRAWARAVEDVTDLEFSAHRYYAYSAHLFGGARRGDVCDSAGRVRGAAGLWVTDASSFPEALGVNPQVTIAALALITADEIAASG
jgi:choline dehydrogenase-like flavoprotein